MSLPNSASASTERMTELASMGSELAEVRKAGRLLDRGLSTATAFPLDEAPLGLPSSASAATEPMAELAASGSQDTSMNFYAWYQATLKKRADSLRDKEWELLMGTLSERSAEGSFKEAGEELIQKQGQEQVTRQLLDQAVEMEKRVLTQELASLGRSLGMGLALDGLLAAGTAAYYQEDEEHFGEAYARYVAPPGEFIGKNVASTLGGYAGGAVGTLLCPGAGSVAGSLAGGALGGLVGGRLGSKLDDSRLSAAIARGHATSTALLLEGYAQKYRPKEGEVAPASYEIPELYESTWAGHTPLHLWVEKLQDPACAASKRHKLRTLLHRLLHGEGLFQGLYVDLTLRNAAHLTALDMAHDPALVELLMPGGWTDYELIRCLEGFFAPHEQA